MHPPPFFVEALSRAASEEYSLNDRQRGASGREADAWMVA